MCSGKTQALIKSSSAATPLNVNLVNALHIMPPSSLSTLTPPQAVSYSVGGGMVKFF